MYSVLKKLIIVALLGFISVANGQINNQNLQHLLDDFRSKNDIGAASMAISFPNETSPRVFFSGTIATNSDQKLNIGNLSQVNSITKSSIAIQYNRTYFSELADPFSPKKEFPRKILKLIEDSYSGD